MNNYQKEDFKRVTWEEYGKTLEVLYENVSRYLRESKIEIDAVVPILRGAAPPAAYLAYRLHILAMLPIQYKYFFEGKKVILKRLSDYPKLKFNLPKKSNFLLVEGNHCFGITAQTAINDLKKEFPGCKIIYAVDHEDASFQKLEGVETNFYGKLTDETRALSKEKAKQLGVEQGISYLLPWEDLDEEWTTVSGRQFKYQGVGADGENKKEMTLGEDYL